MGSARSKNKNGLTDEEEQEKTRVGRLAFWVRRRWKTSFILFCVACYGFYAYMIDKGKKADGEICAAMRNLEAMYMAMIEMISAMVIAGVIATFLAFALGRDIRPTGLLATSIRVAYRGVSLFTAVVSIGYLSFVVTAWTASGICYADDTRKTSQILFSFFLWFGVTIIAIVMNWLERRFTQLCLRPLDAEEDGVVRQLDEDGDREDVVRGLFSSRRPTQYVFEAKTLAKALQDEGWTTKELDYLRQKGYWRYMAYTNPGKSLLFVCQCIVLLLLTVGYTTTNFQLEIFICKWEFKSLPQYKDKTPSIQAYWATPDPNIPRMQIAEIWVLPNPGEEFIKHTKMFPEVDTSHYDMVFGCGILCSVFTYLFLITYPQFSTNFTPFSIGDETPEGDEVKTTTIEYMRSKVPWTMQFGLILLALALSITGVIFATKSPCGGIGTSPLFYVTSTATFCFLAAWVLTFIIFWFIGATRDSLDSMKDDAGEFLDEMKYRMKKHRRFSLTVYVFVFGVVTVLVVAFAMVQGGVNDAPSEPSNSDVGGGGGDSGSGDGNIGSGDSNSGGGANGDSGGGNRTKTPSTTPIPEEAYELPEKAYEFAGIGFEAFLCLTIIIGSFLCCCCCCSLYLYSKMPDSKTRSAQMAYSRTKTTINKWRGSNPYDTRQKRMPYLDFPKLQKSHSIAV